MNEATNILVDVDLEPNSSAKINGNKIKFQTQTSCDSTSSADQGKIKKKIQVFYKEFSWIASQKIKQKGAKVVKLTWWKIDHENWKIKVSFEKQRTLRTKE